MRTLLWKELLEQWRSYRLLVVVAVLTAVGLLGPLTAKYLPQILGSLPGAPPGLTGLLPESDARMAVEQYLKNLAQFGVILAVLVPMAAVAGEKANGTAAVTLSKPVSRAAFLISKFVSLAITFALGVFLAALAGYYYTGLLFQWLPVIGFLALSGLVLLYLMSYASVTLLASTIARSQLAAAGMAVGFLALVGVLGSIRVLANALPAALIPWGEALGLGLNARPNWAAMGVTLGVIVASVALSWAAFRRQEL